MTNVILPIKTRLYVDDSLLLSKNYKKMKKFIIYLRDEFEMETEENPKQFLGIIKLKYFYNQWAVFCIKVINVSSK